jgi:hypothetical protein
MRPSENPEIALVLDRQSEWELVGNAIHHRSPNAPLDLVHRFELGTQHPPRQLSPNRDEYGPYPLRNGWLVGGEFEILQKDVPYMQELVKDVLAKAGLARRFSDKLNGKVSVARDIARYLEIES